MSQENRLDQLLPQDEQSKKILLERARLLAIVSDSEEVANEHRINYIKFTLGNNELYGIPYHDLEEVIDADTITKIPKCPNYIAGILNWHGKFITIVDLEVYLGLGLQNENKIKKVIAVIQSDKFKLGLLFNDVLNVDYYQPEKIDKYLPISTQIKDIYVQGIHNGKITILNVMNILMDVANARTHKEEINHE